MTVEKCIGDRKSFLRRSGQRPANLAAAEEKNVEMHIQPKSGIAERAKRIRQERQKEMWATHRRK